MISTEKIADSLTNYIVENKVIKREDSEIYKYGFWTGIEMIIYIATCCCIAAQMNMIQECLVFFFCFFLIKIVCWWYSYEQLQKMFCLFLYSLYTNTFSC